MATPLPALRNAIGFPFDLMMAIPWTTLFGPSIPIEDRVDGDTYVLRAELPGLDAERDIRLHVTDGELRIRAERSEEDKRHWRGEFRYGCFTRVVGLPPAARVDTVTATYQHGILEVRAELAEPAERGREIPVKVI